MIIHDYIVVGSGCSGAIAAQTLIENGARVTMIDTGMGEGDKNITIPDEDFLALRHTDANQYKYLIGDKASGVSLGRVGKGEQITPPRRHIISKVEELVPTDSKDFSTVESLGYGGLGIGWGLQCWEYSKADAIQAGLNPGELSKAYAYVGDRIGISATNDTAARYTIGSLKKYDDSPRMDENHAYIYDRYLKKARRLNDAGFFMGRTPLALITKDRDNRRGYQYHDMDFYSDNDQSAWRPWITVNKLREDKNFTYIGGHLAIRFKEHEKHTELICLDIATNKEVTFTCRKLILATSALGSGRLVLRSLGNTGQKLPLLCNPYTYVPTIQPKFVGKAAQAGKLGFTQLSLFLDADKNNTEVSVASLYSYQSLMLFRIVRHMPLNFVDSRIIMNYLMSGLVIMGIHHPDYQSANKTISLIFDKNTPTNDKLHISYTLSEAEKQTCRQREKSFIRTMHRLGSHSLGRVDPGNGASIHYAGTLPFSTDQKDFSLDHSGRLHGTKSVYVADSSGFRFLPAPGLTFSLMANAHLTAKAVLNS